MLEAPFPGGALPPGTPAGSQHEQRSGSFSFGFWFELPFAAGAFRPQEGKVGPGGLPVAQPQRVALRTPSG